MAVDSVTAALGALAPGLEACPRIHVAFSGGMDSTVLLHAARPIFGARLNALHAHHGLQQEARRWAAHCAQVCASLEVPLECAELEVKPDGRGLEAAARQARYAWFASRLRAKEALLLAHHLDDQAETLLLRLLRGAGPDGLGAMAMSRSIGEATLHRPLLDLPRSELADYARDHGLAWVEDPMNADERLDRSYLRSRVMPLLEQRWPGYRRTFARSAALLRAEMAGREVPALDTVRAVTGEAGFTLASILGLGEGPGRATALRAWLRSQGLVMPTQVRLREFLRQLQEGQGASLRNRDYCLTRFADAVYCHGPEIPGPVPAQPLGPDDAYSHPAIGRVQVRGLGDEWRERCVLRWRRSGDRIAGEGGLHRSLKQIFQEARVPVWWRERVPLLIHRKASGEEELLAVGPFALAPVARDAGLALDWEPPAAPGSPSPDT